MCLFKTIKLQHNGCSDGDLATSLPMIKLLLGISLFIFKYFCLCSHIPESSNKLTFTLFNFQWDEFQEIQEWCNMGFPFPDPCGSFP